MFVLKILNVFVGIIKLLKFGVLFYMIWFFDWMGKFVYFKKGVFCVLKGFLEDMIVY